MAPNDHLAMWVPWTEDGMQCATMAQARPGAAAGRLQPPEALAILISNLRQTGKHWSAIGWDTIMCTQAAGGTPTVATNMGTEKGVALRPKKSGL